ncbi:MAG TPA: PAS domain-containing protein [Syntrophorhabdaceae bacterium]|nr:PAS domain-containing protein [Syntrophorhabdaceae bacterium]HOL05486.1 PAS domain-containing protein [Syntrophorhabdaceae bacterium]HPP42096.1 PAS domain-containing protein [Syntrophorhabdaceae bacterium]
MSNLIERWFNDSINLGVFTTDKNLVITRWNRWLEINTNKANHEVLGRSLFDLYPEIKNGHIGSYYREALDGKTSVISQKLHGYIIPLPLKPRNTGFPICSRAV